MQKNKSKKFTYLLVGASLFLLILFIIKKLKKMNIKESLFDFLKQEEGYKKVVYKDQAGFATVGVGHKVLPNDNLRIGDRVDDNRIKDFLMKDLERAAKAVTDSVEYQLSPNQFAALVSLVFNIGVGAFKNSTLLKLLNSGADKDSIKKAWLAWNKAGGKPILTGRRIREFEKFYE